MCSLKLLVVTLMARTYHHMFSDTVGRYINGKDLPSCAL